VIRLLQRLAILALGALSVWLIVFVVFRIADNRLPWILALSATYGIGPYVILPRAVRMSLKITQRKRVPRYTAVFRYSPLAETRRPVSTLGRAVRVGSRGRRPNRAISRSSPAASTRTWRPPLSKPS